MMSRKVHKKTIFSFIFVIFFFFLCACSNSESSKATANFGADADYFIGLKKLSQGEEKEARVKFLHCVKKGTDVCAKKSAQALVSFGSVQQKNNAALDLIKSYDDSDSLLIAIRQLYNANEIHNVIQATENLDIKKEYNSILKIRFDALKKLGDSSFKEQVFSWFVLRPISHFHSQFYYENKELFLDDSDFRNTIIRFRMNVYERIYEKALTYCSFVFDCLQNGTVELYPELSSDIGKTYLNAGRKFAQNAELFENFAKDFKETPLEFDFLFYTGRFYEKARLYFKAYSSYLKAFEATTDSSQKDKALWYFLKNDLNLSVTDCVPLLEKYAPSICDPTYYDDYFDTLLVKLLNSSNKKLIFDVYKKINGYASKETCSKYAYVYARLLQDDFVRASDSNGYSDSDRALLIKELFESALDSGSNVYYKIMAAYRLNYKDSQIEQILYKDSNIEKTDDFVDAKKSGQKSRKSGKSGKKSGDSAKKLSGADALLQGYAHFGFPEKIYTEWNDFSPQEISTDTSFMIADFLLKCSAQNQEYAVQSLRIAAKAATKRDRSLNLAELKLIYPQNYSEYIDTFSRKYDITNSTVYALVRSESFFDSQVKSYAGAIGLTQLMELTAQDVARKLKISDYSLVDAQTNLEFGTYYLAEMYRRCNNSMLLAFFSYNAGITRVRRWVQTSTKEFGAKNDLSRDIFLEILPYEETREYGRKLISACAMYELLYSENSYDSCQRTIDALIY